MATADNNDLTFYPSFCFKASPTHFTWVKIAAIDAQKLQRRREYPDEQTYFYNNHPIRYISLLGLIIARTDLARRTILTLDDSSGATIEIVVLKADGPSKPQSQFTSHTTTTTQPTTSYTGHTTTDTTTQPTQPTHQTPTTHTPIDITPLQPGALAHVKGTITTFRGAVQLNLERMFLVRDTNTEMRFVDQRSRFLVEVLAVPWWVGGAEEVERLRGEAEEEEERVVEEQERLRRRQRRREEREERDRRRIMREWEREERGREKEAGWCRDEGGRVMRERKASGNN
ncbi:hypothetical protein BO71DRAFT_479294 [Aspergillus ellipticus CBS 707.79]|uniref:CST complex subunit Stn1 N-terminal domain-containing protein n=1 Tax=Aspergillus ellipticus CBS 707.79 TaxID=1448320 RepID=A0A319DPV5_9EURO|nr:hypothetical protein BO71DRAFT_479294 [Aspergillus ellipticus CBS 707.79]